MQLDPEYLRRHYASLSDDALLEIDRADLVAMARTIFDEEVGRRQLAPPRNTRRPQGPQIDPRQSPPANEPEDLEGELPGDADKPAWLEEAAEVYSYAVAPGTAPAPDALNARDVLDAAGIPCYLELCEVPEEKSALPPPAYRWRLMVPGKLNLRAASLLDREIFNAEFEADWKTHLEALSDEELREMNPQVAFCGLYDRIERVNRIYKEENARRGLPSGPASR